MEAMEPSVAALLAPWLNHGRRAMYAALDDLAEPRDLTDDLWITMNLVSYAHAPDEWLWTLETMELLDLFVRVEYRAGWNWIFETLEMPLNMTLLDALPDAIFPRFTVCCQSPDEQAFAGVEMVLDGVPEDRHTVDFYRVRATLMRRWNKAQRDPENRIHVCLEVDLEALDLGRGAAWATHRLAELAALAYDPERRALVGRLAHEQATHSSDATRTFCLARVDVSTGEAPLTPEMLGDLRAIHRCGVQVSSLSIDLSADPPDELPVGTTLDLLRSLVLPPAPASALMLGRSLHTSTFQAICSALAVTRSVYDVSITMPAADQDHWAWIAYALFRRDSVNTVEYVHLSLGTITLQDIVKVERVLRARNPLAALRSPPTGSTEGDALGRDPQVVDVRPNAVGSIHVRRADRTELESVWFDKRSSTDLRVVDDSLLSTHVAVVYPGAGVCWLRREDIVARRSLPSPDPRSQRSPPRRISLELDPSTSLEVVLAFIRLVGSLARILLLSAPEGNLLPDDFMHDVLAACPQLERLDLYEVSLASFKWLSGVVATRIESVRFTSVSCQDALGYAPFFDALRDTQSGIGRSLRELALSTVLEAVKPSWSNLTAMLAANHRLERVLLRAHNTPQEGEYKTLAQQLDKSNGDPLHAQEKPFPVRSRLALLSVLARRDSATQDLDVVMLAIIFAMAAPHKQRECGLARKLQRTRE